MMVSQCRNLHALTHDDKKMGPPRRKDKPSGSRIQPRTQNDSRTKGVVSLDSSNNIRFGTQAKTRTEISVALTIPIPKQVTATAGRDGRGHNTDDTGVMIVVQQQ